jgi:hypothetical protein
MGLATLGKTCALGLLIDGVISLFLLPKAWDLWFPRPTNDGPPAPPGPGNESPKIATLTVF